MAILPDMASFLLRRTGCTSCYVITKQVCSLWQHCLRW